MTRVDRRLDFLEPPLIGNVDIAQCPSDNQNQSRSGYRLTCQSPRREQMLLLEPVECALLTEGADNSCKAADSKYTCPRCNVPYCSLACFQSQVGKRAVGV